MWDGSLWENRTNPSGSAVPHPSPGYGATGKLYLQGTFSHNSQQMRGSKGRGQGLVSSCMFGSPATFLKAKGSMIVSGVCSERQREKMPYPVLIKAQFVLSSPPILARLYSTRPQGWPQSHLPLEGYSRLPAESRLEAAEPGKYRMKDTPMLCHCYVRVSPNSPTARIYLCTYFP